MQKKVALGLLTLVLVAPLLLTVYTRLTYANPDIAPGTLYNVVYPDGTQVPFVDPGGDGRRWVVVPGGSYRVNITNVELTGTTDVWIKGTTTTGDSWNIHLVGQAIVDGMILSDVFEIPDNAGCTIVVAYWKIGHLAQDVRAPGTPGHMKTYFSDQPPFDDEVPCEAPSVPELPLASAVVTSIGLVGALLLRYRYKKRI